MNGLAFSGIPLGGLGTGSVELRSDGYLHDWQIANNAPWGSGPQLSTPADNGWFGLQFDDGTGIGRSLVLGTVPEHRGHSTTAAWNDPYVLPYLEYASSIEVDIAYPFTRLRYHYEHLALAIELEAFSPFVPHDSRASGTPAAYLRFRIINEGGQEQKLCIFGALRNIVGYTQELPSTVEISEDGAAAIMRLSREGLAAGAQDSGDLVLACEGPGEATWLAHARTRDIWEPLREFGRLDDRDLGAFEGSVGNAGDEKLMRARYGQPLCLLGRHATLAAGEAADVTFTLAWYFPHMFDRPYGGRQREGSEIGHRYASWFDDALGVYREAARERETRRAASLAFSAAFHDGDQPRWLLDAVAAQLSTLVKASWWDHQGRFGIWEGLGCCGLQTTDISHYGSFPILQCFPDLELSQVRLTRQHIDGRGRVPHMMPGNFGCCDMDPHMRKDLVPQYVLAIWRDVLWTGDIDFLRELWPSVVQAIVFSRDFDANGDGLPDNAGPDQTYDQFPMKGTSSLVGFLYAAMLRAAGEMAELLDEGEMATEFREEHERAMATLDEQLWTGSYYRLSHDCADGSSDDGVMTDQINADWFVRQATGTPLVDNERARSALTTVLKHCRRPQGYIANASWPQGGGVQIGRHTANQAEWPWSGVEYALAAHLSLLGMEEDCLQVTRQVWERYERAGLRFNHIECGGHYYRALSSWAIYLARYGFCWNALRQELRLRLHDGADCLAVGHEGWARVRRDGDGIGLTMMAGTMTLARLDLGLEAIGAVTRSRQAIGARLEDGVVVLDAPARLTPGEVMLIA